MTGFFTGLILVAVVMTPGVPGELIYSKVVGEDWQEKRISYIVRVLFIGMVGLVLTILVSAIFSGPVFSYVDVTGRGKEATLIPPAGWEFSIAYLTHLTFSAGVGAVLGWAHHQYAERHGTIQPYAWDDLINNHAEDHWVVVVTTEGDVFAGKIETADDYVGPSQRDILLEEPARYDEDKDGYFATEYQHIFLPSDLIESVAVMTNPEEDARLSDIGQKVF